MTSLCVCVCVLMRVDSEMLCVFAATLWHMDVMTSPFSGGFGNLQIVKAGMPPYPARRPRSFAKVDRTFFFCARPQVTELKGLATHLLVGSIICETKELFTAMPQVVAVDVNDLATIKLNLEVTWL